MKNKNRKASQKKRLNLAKQVLKCTNVRNLARIAAKNEPTLYRKGDGKMKNEKICSALNSGIANTNLFYRPAINICLQ